MRTSTLVIAVFGFLLVPDTNHAQQTTTSGIQFDRDIRPILSDKCFHCHGPAEETREADLRLDVEAAAKESAILPGRADESELIRRVVSGDPDTLMPPPSAKKPLTAQEVDLLRRWVDEGAEWTEHWAFIAPQQPAIPAVSDVDWCRNPIDHFIRRRLEQEGLQPAPAADRRTLIRRATYDLIGLPPTPAEVDAFLTDTDDDAWEKVIDRLLASPHYGERMALMWLDAARYGDTSVFHADGPRDMWAWRDNVVAAYNNNMPFDQFSTEQLAGDLLPDATVAQRVASGFNRNNGTTDEGGAIAEEYRVEYAVDRVKTTATVWLGLTMECAQCHDHKYDPISQRDYYQFYAFFNVSADAGMQTRNGNAAPTVAVPDPEKQRQLPAVQQQLAEINTTIEQHVQAAEPALQSWIQQQEAALAAGNTVTLPEDPLLYFPLDEGKGRETLDAGNDQIKGTLQGDPEWTAARRGQGLRLDGKAWVDLATQGDFERTDEFSYGGWIRPETPISGAVLARMDNNDSFRGYDMLLSDGHVEVHIVHKWPENAIKVRTKQKLTADKWQHVFATYDGTSTAAGITIYVDGQPWEWDIQQDRLQDTIRTSKTLLIGSRHPDSKFRGLIDDVHVYGRQLNASDVQALAGVNPIAPLLQIAAEDRTPEQVTELRDHYLQNVDDAYQTLLQKKSELKAREENLLQPLTTVMVMQDMDKPRETFILDRGAYHSPTDVKVSRNTPAVLPPMSAETPRNRLGLVQWLFDDGHPLTARVAVNRYWQLLFGTGIVATPEDFGAQGAFPSHPQLLDWLATDFRASNWNVKRFLKQMMMSSTYQQSARVTPELHRKDPGNRLLARGPRFRLQGEMIRDTALMVSGLLNPRMGGPGVKPYQPPGLWVEVGLSGKPEFVQDHDDKLYRRSIYTYWKRSAPPPSMSIFDAPTREKCTIRRSRTNTPLQALVTLNDIQFVEAARHLGQRLLLEGGESDDEKIQLACLLATSRKPSQKTTASLTGLLQSAREFYAQDQEAAAALLQVGESGRDETLDIVEHCAWTIVASAILNLDETLTRG
jgi:hypothetical protein